MISQITESKLLQILNTQTQAEKAQGAHMAARENEDKMKETSWAVWPSS